MWSLSQRTSGKKKSFVLGKQQQSELQGKKNKGTEGKESFLGAEMIRYLEGE